jgi:hypothetical protein
LGTRNKKRRALRIRKGGHQEQGNEGTSKERRALRATKEVTKNKERRALRTRKYSKGNWRQGNASRKGTSVKLWPTYFI